MEQGMDLFNDMVNMLKCSFLSDLKLAPYQNCAKILLKHLNLESYPLCQLSDMAQYLYGRKAAFSSKAEALSFFAAYDPTE